MTIKFLARVLMVVIAAASVSAPRAWAGRAAVADEDQTAEDRQYQSGTRALDERQWDGAIRAFGDVIAMKGARADAAMYWTAWALNKQGNLGEALSTIDTLRKTYPKSRWITEARALETEIRGASGQPVRPENEPDEDLKLIAINSLMNSDSERAIPMLEKFLQGSESRALKERALFVLAQSDSPRARAIIAEIAKGNRSPDLQDKALNYLGIFGGRENRQTLQDIYVGTNDPQVKRRILHSFMVAGEQDRLLAVANGEQNADLRAEAVKQLGVMGADEALWQIYQKESAISVRKQIIQAMFVGGSADRLIDLARTEKELELRKAAIHNLGLVGTDRTAAALVAIYNSDKNLEIRRAVIEGLFLQDGARELVDLARKETDPTMRKELVSKLSIMDSKEATDFLMELLIKP